MSHLLELNDWQLSCYTEQGQCIYQQAAAAFAQDDQVTFGGPALAQGRIQPQTFNIQYLSRLSTEVLPRAIGPARNYADLIYHHLRAIQAEHGVTRAVVATPAHYSDEQLGLLLGIADEAGLNIQGFVEAALGHATATSTANYHLFDIGLNQTNLSELIVDHAEIRVGSASVFEGSGILGIVDAWLQVIANAFLQSSRFDPLHSAETEQQAFDQALAWIIQGMPSDPQVTIDIDGQPRKADIPHTQLMSALELRLPLGDLKDLQTIGLTPRIASIPGLSELLSDRCHDVVTVTHDPQQLLTLYEPFAEGAPIRVVQGPLAATSATVADSAPATKQPEADTSSPATHLLAEHHALALTADAVRAYFDEDGLLRPGAEVLVNGTAPTRARLRCGDEVQSPMATWVAIRLSD
jgi:hypothetical protein